MKLRTPPGSAGVTLIELLVVLVILGLLLGLAAPAMGGMINRSATQSAINHLTGDIAYARMLAVRNGQRAMVNLSATGYTVTVNLPDGGTRTAKTTNLASEYPGMTLVPPAGLTVLSFNSRGLLMLDGTGDREIKITRRGRTESVFVSPIGRTYRDY